MIDLFKGQFRGIIHTSPEREIGRCVSEIKRGGSRGIRYPFASTGAVFIRKPIISLAAIDLVTIHFEIHTVQLFSKLCAYVVGHSAAFAGLDIGYNPGWYETQYLAIDLFTQHPQRQGRRDLSHCVYDLITHVDKTVGIYHVDLCAVSFVNRIRQGHLFAHADAVIVDQIVYHSTVYYFIQYVSLCI